jgi:hypothetical protein
MKKLLAVALLAGCGGGFQGKVSGYGLQVADTFFLADSSTAALVLTDQTDLCAALAAPNPPPNATAMAFSFSRRSDGNLLSPDTGDYTVSTTPGSGNFATGLFLHTDANANNVVPAANSVAVSGVLSVDSFTEGQTMGGNFDGRFGAQNDVVTFAFNAHFCSLSPQAFAQGFLGGGRVAVGASGGSCTIASGGTCLEYLGSSYTVSAAQASCSQSSGTWSAGACKPSTAGWCTLNAGTPTEVRWTAYGLPVQSACTNGQFSQ